MGRSRGASYLWIFPVRLCGEEGDIPSPLEWAVVISALATLLLVVLTVVIMLIYQRRLATSAQQWGRSVLRAQERERQRIASELHDDVLQRLHGAMLQLGDGSPNGIEIASALIRGVTGDLRRLSHELYPPAIQRVGLLGALRDLSEQCTTASGLDLVISTNADDELLDERVAVNLFRIAQEALRNAIVHGKAERVEIGLERNAKQLVLTIADTGRGGGEFRTPREGFGLRSMRERVGELGGELAITSAAGHGWTIRAMVPLQ